MACLVVIHALANRLLQAAAQNNTFRRPCIALRCAALPAVALLVARSLVTRRLRGVLCAGKAFDCATGTPGVGHAPSETLVLAGAVAEVAVIRRRGGGRS